MSRPLPKSAHTDTGRVYQHMKSVSLRTPFRKMFDKNIEINREDLNVLVFVCYDRLNKKIKMF